MSFPWSVRPSCLVSLLYFVLTTLVFLSIFVWCASIFVTFEHSNLDKILRLGFLVLFSMSKENPLGQRVIGNIFSLEQICPLQNRETGTWKLSSWPLYWATVVELLLCLASFSSELSGFWEVWFLGRSFRKLYFGGPGSGDKVPYGEMKVFASE